MFYAKDGNMVLKLTKEKEFDLILLDIMMPEIDGFEVCQQLKTKVAIHTQLSQLKKERVV